MAWTTPRSWTPGETVTAAIYNQHIRDEEIYLKNNAGALGTAYFGDACTLTRNASWTLTNTTWTSVPHDTVVHDPNSWQTTTPDTYGIKVPAAGRYLITYTAMFYNVSHNKWIRFYLNGTSACGQKVRVGGDNWARTSHRMVYDFDADDYIHVQYYQGSGSSQTVVGTSSYAYSNHFSVTRLV